MLTLWRRHNVRIQSLCCWMLVLLVLSGASPARALIGADLGTTPHPLLEASLQVASDDLVADPDGSLAFVAQGAVHRALAVNVHTGRILATIPLPTGARHLAVDGALHHLYLPDEFSASLVVVDTRTWRRLAIVSLGRIGSQPHGVAVDDSTHLVYVTEEHHATVAIVDGLGMKLLASVSVGPTPGGIAVDPALGLVDTVLVGADAVAVFSTSSSPASDTIPPVMRILVGHRPTHLALDRARHRAFVLATGGNAITILQQQAGPLASATRAQTLSPALPLGFAPYSVAVDAMSGAAFIGSSKQRSLVVVTAAPHGYQLRLIHLDTVPGALAVDSVRRLLLVAGARPGPPLLEEIQLADLLTP